MHVVDGLHLFVLGREIRPTRLRWPTWTRSEEEERQERRRALRDPRGRLPTPKRFAWSLSPAAFWMRLMGLRFKSTASALLLLLLLAAQPPAHLLALLILGSAFDGRVLLSSRQRSTSAISTRPLCLSSFKCAIYFGFISSPPATFDLCLWDDAATEYLFDHFLLCTRHWNRICYQAPAGFSFFFSPRGNCSSCWFSFLVGVSLL